MLSFYKHAPEVLKTIQCFFIDAEILGVKVFIAGVKLTLIWPSKLKI